MCAYEKLLALHPTEFNQQGGGSQGIWGGTGTGGGGSGSLTVTAWPSSAGERAWAIDSRGVEAP